MKEILLKYLTRFTTLNEEEKKSILKDILVQEYKKGTLLLRQGEVPTKCYFILKGCVRQYSIDEMGREFTSNFYTEEQSISIFNHHKKDKSSAYSFTCTEDCILVVGDLATNNEMFTKYTQLESMTHKMVEEKLGAVQDELAEFIASTPEDRYKALLQKRPNLVNRVPQHQLASYLGITPESLSRIKKRIEID
ncbi:Crp/Fnr family transcriptional regulator [Bacillus sp. RG28]|uniref:Crp/Fnr family transcriptional regulator n=1 Tax=Gottfriedia endophytica TaxID=2820819 RepID=A0A940SIY1_9BACI|nr:Crp/Fnr family transcriptional regulator [Gottfriedia endophytica]MBP0723648.1 Crp/Fnr family transcriptional regulator [Gottfriedia endophytica]